MPEPTDLGWVEEAAGAHGLLPEAPGASGSVSLAVMVAPRREAAWHWTYEDGKPVEGGPGLAEEGSLALTLAAADAADVFSGRVDPSVAFMRGRLKASGDGGLLLAFLRSTNDPGFAAWREAVGRVLPEL